MPQHCETQLLYSILSSTDKKYIIPLWSQVIFNQLGDFYHVSTLWQPNYLIMSSTDRKYITPLWSQVIFKPVRWFLSCLNTVKPNYFTLFSPLRQWCGWNSTQHQTWRRALCEEFVHASILCWRELYCFGVRRYFWKRTNKCVAELQTLGGKNSSVFNACNSRLMLGGKFQRIRGMLGGKCEDAGWKLHERVRKRSK